MLLCCVVVRVGLDLCALCALCALALWRIPGVVRTWSGAGILSRGRLSQVRQLNGVIELTTVDLIRTYVLHLVGVSFIRKKATAKAIENAE